MWQAVIVRMNKITTMNKSTWRLKLLLLPIAIFSSDFFTFTGKFKHLTIITLRAESRIQLSFISAMYQQSELRASIFSYDLQFQEYMLSALVILNCPHQVSIVFNCSDWNLLSCNCPKKTCVDTYKLHQVALPVLKISCNLFSDTC